MECNYFLSGPRKFTWVTSLCTPMRLFLLRLSQNLPWLLVLCIQSCFEKVDVLVICRKQVLLEAQVQIPCKLVERTSIYSSFLMSGVLAHLQEAASAGMNFRAMHCLSDTSYFCSCAGIFKGDSDITIKYLLLCWKRRCWGAELHLVLMIPPCYYLAFCFYSHSTCLGFCLTCT